MGREFELKFRATQGQQETLRQLYTDWETIQMETTYYDTADHALSQRKITLRRRLENGCPVCTVKTPAGGAGRGEWECQAEDIAAALETLCKLGAPAELTQWTKSGLVVSCGARFTRLCRKIEGDGSVMELALDRGVLLGGGRERPLCEVELEHKSGSEAATARFAADFAAQYGLEPEEKSKFRRANDLAMGR